MGSSSSKVAKTAATGAARRQYPQRVPQSSPQSATAPAATPKPQSSSSRDEAIDVDAKDPDFARSLRSIGPVNPHPTFSNTSTMRPSADANTPIPSGSRQPIFPSPSSNPALQVLAARERLAREANEELSQAGRPGHGGKQFLDVLTVKRILTLREGGNGNAGISDGEIEKALGLKGGLAGKLGDKVFAVVD